MVRDIGLAFFGFIHFIAFIIVCLWGIDENGDVRFNGKVYISKGRIITALLTIFLALWQFWVAINELTPPG
jgi:hypothetical protein